MAKVAVALRLSPEKLERVDAYAKLRSSSRQVVLEAAVDSFLEDSERGVPDLPVVDSPEVRQVRAAAMDEIKRAEQEMRAAVWARQQKLNEAKERASR